MTPISPSARELPLVLSEADRRLVEEIEQAASREDLDALIERLDEPSWAVRRAVVTALAQLGTEAVRKLTEVLRTQRDDENRIAAVVDSLVASSSDVEQDVLVLAEDPNPAVAADVAQILGRRHSASGIPTLARLVDHEDDNVAAAAIEALGHIGGRAVVDTLISAVSSGRFFRVFPAIDVLGRTSDPRAVEPLAQLLDDPRYTREAARALGRTADRAAVAPLVRLLGSPSDALVRLAALSLEEMSRRFAERYGDSQAIGASVREVVNDAAHVARRLGQCYIGAETDEQAAICSMLGALRSAASVPVLTRALDGAPPTAAAAVEALRDLSDAAVDQLVGAVRGGDSARRRLLLPLFANRPDLVEDIAACLDDPEPIVRTLAADVLGQMGNPSAVRPLFRHLGDPNAGIVRAVEGAIESIGGTETQRLAAESLRSRDALVRRSAVRILSYFGHGNSADLVVEATRDPDERVRAAAVQGLPFFDEPIAREALFEAARHESPRTRAAAARAIGHGVGDMRSASFLLRALQDPDAWVRYYAAQSIGRLGLRRAAEHLAQLVDDPAGQVRVAAVEGLAQLDGDAAYSALSQAAVSTDPDVQRAALIGLGMSQRTEAIPTLLSAISAADTPTRLVAVSAIAAFDSPAVVRALSDAATDSDDGVREAAIGFLAARTSFEGTAALVGLLRTQAVRERAVTALSIPSEGRIAGIVRALETADDETAPWLTAALARMHRPDAFDALLRALSLSNAAARKAVSITLAGIGTHQALAALRLAAERDPDPEVRRVCALCFTT